MSGEGAGVRVPKQERGVERRRALIESAALVFEREGFAEATLADISAHADSTTGAIYFYFHNKHDLALAVIGEQNARTFETLEHAREADAGFRGLIEGSRLFADLLLTDPVVRAGIRLSLEQNSVATETAVFYRGWISELESTYAAWKGAGELREDVSARTMARATVPFFTGVHVMSEIVDDWRLLYQDVQGMWETLVRAFAVPERHGGLLSESRLIFSRPQPALSRGRVRG